MSVEDKVKKIIAEKLSVEVNEVVPEASFVDDLGADSLDLVELIMAVEEEFDIDISDEDAEKMACFKDVLDYINAHSEDRLDSSLGKSFIFIFLMPVASRSFLKVP